MLNRIEMMKLCAIAHQDAGRVPGLVADLDPDLSVVWGPAWKSDGLKRVPYSFAYVARSASTGRYTVVIRGTTLASLRAWISEDFRIDETVAFRSFVPGAPEDALLSKGAANGLQDLLGLVSSANPTEEGKLLAFLASREDLRAVAVTGHSLGGTLTGPLFAKLHDALGAGRSGGPEMDLMSFAGLTPGNQGFADYLDGLTPRMGWRVVNPLDVAPHFFSDLDGVLHIYDAYGKPCPPRDRLLLRALFAKAATVYVQPGGAATLLPAEIEKAAFWEGELAKQHRYPHYVALVEQAGG